MEKFGIEALKVLVAFACSLTKQITTSLADGWQWTDAPAFLNEALQIPNVVKNFPAIKQEIADLSAEERAELHAFIIDKFDIPNDKTEAFIEDGLGFALHAVSLVEQWKALKAAKES